MKIVMVGTGYVGLVSGACFASFGLDVTCVDKDEKRIARLSEGDVTIFEPGLPELVATGLSNRKLRFTTHLADAVSSADAVFIAVGTPSRRGDGHADLRYVEAAAAEIATALSGYTVIVTKSTVPVGTSRRVGEIIREANPGASFDIVANPEFLREGSAINDFIRPDRVIIGTESEQARDLMMEIYRPLRLMDTPIVMTTAETAELTKYAANAFLATKIAFINEIADLCERSGADVQDVARGLGFDRRIGNKFLNAGPGFGGSCLPKDSVALMRSAQEYGSPLRLIETVVSVNETRKGAMASRVISAAGGSIRNKTVGVLGVAFKANTDDMRAAPALSIIPALQDAGATVRAFDPAAMRDAALLLPDVVWCTDPYVAATGADVLVLITEWEAFRTLDLARLGSLMKQRVLVDLRNVYQPEEVREAGFRYSSIGRS